MAQGTSRPSLMDDIDIAAKPGKGGRGTGGSGGDDNASKKVIAAAVMLVLAGILLAWNFGLIGGGGKGNEPTPSSIPDRPGIRPMGIPKEAPAPAPG